MPILQHLSQVKQEWTHTDAFALGINFMVVFASRTFSLAGTLFAKSRTFYISKTHIVAYMSIHLHSIDSAATINKIIDYLQNRTINRNYRLATPTPFGNFFSEAVALQNSEQIMKQLHGCNQCTYL